MSRHFGSFGLRNPSAGIFSLCGLLALFVLTVSTTTFAHEGWETNMDKAMAQAKKEGKDIFVDFSGSDWCHWCQVLDKEIFSEAAFAPAKDKFVLVSLDFPQGETKLTAAEKKHNEEWRQKFEVGGFPMVFLLDASGRPYARTGYKEGGPEKYMTHLEELIAIRKKRDDSFALADSAQGVDRAKHLDTAIQTMEPGIAWLGYEPTIREIAKLDAADAAGLKTKYGEGLQRRIIGKELQVIMKDFDPSEAAAAVPKLKALEAKVAPTGKVREDLRVMIAKLLMQAGKKDDAIQICDEMLADESLGDVSRMNWAVLKVNALASSKDFDGALAELDKLSGSAALEGPQEVAIGGLRAQILVGAGREPEAIKVLDALIPKVPAGEMQQQLTSMRDQIAKRAEAKKESATEELAPAK